MDLLVLFHFTLLFFPFGLILLDYIYNYKINKRVALIILLIYYMIPIIWSLNNNTCPLTDLERKDPKNKEIFEKFPDAPFLPLHWNDFLTKTFKILNIEYNNRNVEYLITGWNVLDFLIIMYYIY
jgi:hypothetical protein